jgi:hypothetical protein
MAYPAKLFMQREEELPDPNVDPIGYAEALQRREAARSVAAAGPASLDPLEAAAAPIAADPMLDAPPIAEIPAPDMAQPMEVPEQQPEVAAVQMAPARPDRNDHVARAMRIHGPNWGRFVAQSQLGGGRRTPQSIAAESLLNDMSPEWRQLVNAHLLTGGLGRATTPLDVAVQQADFNKRMELQRLQNQGAVDVAGVRQQGDNADRALRREEGAAGRDLAMEKIEREAQEAAKEREARAEERNNQLLAQIGMQGNALDARFKELELNLGAKNPNADSTRQLQDLQRQDLQAKRTQDAVEWAEKHIASKYAWDRGWRNLVPWGSSEFTPQERQSSLNALMVQFPWLREEPGAAQRIIDSIAARKSAT